MLKTPSYLVDITEAKQLEEDFEIGEETYEKITLESFGRRAMLACPAFLASRAMRLEKD